MRWLLMSVLVLSMFSLVSCISDESDDIAKAQACLDKVPQNDPEQADSCLQFVAKYNSQQANILKCSIYLTSGGLMEDKVVQAYNALKTLGGAAPPNATFFVVMALDVPDKAGGLIKAQTAKPLCDATGISSFKTVSSYILMGTTINGLLADPDPTSGSGQAEIAAQINTCATAPATAGCDPATIGGAAIVLADSYCNSEKADAKICADVNAAIGAAGGDPQLAGEALYCYLNGDTMVGGVCM